MNRPMNDPPVLTSPHEFAARAVAADVERREAELLAEAEQGHEPAMALLGNYWLWLNRKPGELILGEWLVEAQICYQPMPHTWDWSVVRPIVSAG